MIMRRQDISLLVALLAVLAFGATGARACDMHGDDFAPMTAYIDYRGMTEAQMRAADAKALEEAHEAARTRAMTSARYALTQRFNIKVDKDAPPASALAEAQPSSDPS